MEWPENASKFNLDEIYDKLKGCVYGAAIGDAIGLATEFMSKEKARKLYGIGPITFGTEKGYEFYIDRQRERWNDGDWTDDTANDGIFNSRDFAMGLKKWVDQGFPELDNKPPCGIGLTVGSVLNHPQFLKKPHKSAWDIWIQYDRNMAANGALMRTSILGVPFFWDEKQVIKQTLQATKVTHADPRCGLSSIILTSLISRLIKGNVQDIPTDLTEEDKKEILNCNKMSKMIEKVKHLNHSSSKSPSINELWLKRRKRSSQLNKPREPAIIPDPLPPGIELFGVDPVMLALIKSLVDRYKFIILNIPDTSQEKPSSKKNKKIDSSRLQTDLSEEALKKYCFPESLASLELDEPSSIGYVYKCLGSALYCVTRNLNKVENESVAFKKIITELALEAGDADTNATVAGALLGTRIGYNKLPKEWVEGLKYKTFLDEKINNLWKIMSNSDWVDVKEPIID
ncbi:10939_t:CDS:2 [Diversispora eburnea]|uniref:10939_t:CDS:1 n=1 Tax=Diversispora eburnea TaxID=1213867 RepID=A0A9N8VKG6_9GLOM|nr:10939_t:CDS:2 [Diversispora eburnea]